MRYTDINFLLFMFSTVLTKSRNINFYKILIYTIAISFIKLCILSIFTGKSSESLAILIVYNYNVINKS